jgi:hypothetical protein
MDELKIGKDFKIGKQEILLDPNETANKCGYRVDPLLANDLFVRREDGTTIPLVDFIIQDRISIENLQATVEGLDVTLTWQGTNDVTIKVDDLDPTTPNGDRQHTLTLNAGQHHILVKANRDLRGLTVDLLIDEPGVINTQIEYGVDDGD